MALDKSRYQFIRDIFSKNVNVSEKIDQVGYDEIELLYELQSGSYTDFASRNASHIDVISSEIVGFLEKYVSPDLVILDCGIGEATSFNSIYRKLGLTSHCYGIDASWSRLSWAQSNLKAAGINDFSLAVADIGAIPLETDSVDAILTVHALEPNGGREFELLQELSRVSAKYIFLVEPDYSLASPQQMARMMRLGYVNNLRGAITDLGLRLLSTHTIESSYNELNRASLFVLEIPDAPQKEVNPFWVDPTFHNKLEDFRGGLRTIDGLWFPVLDDIPFLRRSDQKYAINPPSKQSRD